jgi:flagellar biosynthetic protein FlhB
VLAYVFQLRAFNKGGGKYPDRPTKLAVPPELDPLNPASQKKPEPSNKRDAQSKPDPNHGATP